MMRSDVARLRKRIAERKRQQLARREAKVVLEAILAELEQVAKLIEEGKLRELFSRYGTKRVGLLVTRLREELEK